MIELLWWHWAVVGFAFIIVELMMPGFVLMWFGLGAFLVVLAMLLVPDLSLTFQLLLWSVSSILMVFLWFKVFKPGAHKVLIGRSSAHIEGEIGMLTVAVAPFKNGKVRFQKPILGSDTWECVADEPIDIGARVKVVRVEGSMLTVAKAN